jgi:hypothetical protein
MAKKQKEILGEVKEYNFTDLSITIKAHSHEEALAILNRELPPLEGEPLETPETPEIEPEA